MDGWVRFIDGGFGWVGLDGFGWLIRVQLEVVGRW